MRKLHDRYFRQAKRENKLARSIYKLEELDRADKLLRPGDRVLDLGAAPGSWLEHILARVGPGGVVCAVDLKVIDRKFKGRVHFRRADARELAPDAFSDVAPAFDVVLSDMAPNTTGIRITDQARSLELCESAWGYARRALRPGGHFVCKIFDSPDADAFRQGLSGFFRDVRSRKPDACRGESFERYFVGLHFQPSGLPGESAINRSVV